MEPMRTPYPGTRRRNQPTPLDIDQAAPRLEWPAMFSYLQREFQQGDHVAIIGPTGTGKTHMALEIAEIRTYVLVVACKPRDPLVTDTMKRGYWHVPGNKLEIPYADGVPLHKRVVYWPRLSKAVSDKMPAHRRLKAERDLQKPLVGGALGYVRSNGHWALVLDEGTWICRDLNLQREVDSALFQFRTLNASMIVLGQRPAWMGRYVLSQPTHLFLFNTNDTNDKKALGDIGGVDTKLVQHLVGQLDKNGHECLYINTRHYEMFRTVAPPR